MKSNIKQQAFPKTDPLIEQCKQGDRKAQHTLYNRYLRAMHRVAMRITGDSVEAEDVIQEAFVRAFRNLNKFKGDATFGAWLKRIVINTSINHLKKRKGEFVDIEDERLELPNEEVIPGPATSWNMQQIEAAMHQLPDGYRSVFQLYLLEGYDHKEIGSILNISEATSKSQFSRAKRKMRELLQHSRFVTSGAFLSSTRSAQPMPMYV
ncbi:MAG: RNA polymerase sigma factor [Bacteroidota bacterium]